MTGPTVVTGPTGVGVAVGVLLPVAEGAAAVKEAARRAEAWGFDSIWLGDHLLPGYPVLDSTITLATAAAVTDRIAVGLSVFVPALRPLVWAAKQLATLQVVSGGRLIAGIGSGGPWPDEWEAAGVPHTERGRRTDLALERLPDLLAGTPTAVGGLGLGGGLGGGENGGPVVTLAPAVTRPPFWIGGMSNVAIRRAATHGDAWFPSLVDAATVAVDGARMRELAADGPRPAPGIAVGGTLALGPDADIGPVVAGLVEGYGMDPATAATIPITGAAGQAAERLHAYAEAGADHLVLGAAAGPDWRRQYDLLAEARALVAEA